MNNTRDGYLLICRALFEKPWWKKFTATQKLITLTLIEMTRYKDGEYINGNFRIPVKRGQVHTTLPKIAERCGKGVSVQQIRTVISTGKLTGFLTDTPTAKGRLITLVNYDFYQDISNYVTGISQAQQQADQQAHQQHKKESIKKERSKKERDQEEKTQFAEFVTLTETEHAKLTEKYGGQATAYMIETLDNWKGQSEKNKNKYTSDYRAILNWVVRRYNEDKKKGLIMDKPAPNNSKFANVIQS